MIGLGGMISFDGATKSYAGSDYPWRAILPNRVELLKLMEKLGNSVDYPNFKATVGTRKDQKDRITAYHQIWAIMGKEQNIYVRLTLSFSAYRRGLPFRDMTRPRTLGVGRGKRLFTRPPLDRMHKIFCAIKAGNCPNRTGLAGKI